MQPPTDAYDSLQLAGELCQRALRGPRGAERLQATRRAADALAASIAVQERAILIRWQAVGRDEIRVEEVAPSLDMRKDLAADMEALGWEMFYGTGVYRRHGVPFSALSRADWDGAVKALADSADGSESDMERDRR